jgi:hypothetical protein
VSTTFVFRLDEQNLRSALSEIEANKKAYACQDWALETSIELIPDGVGYESRNLSVKVVADTEDGFVPVYTQSTDVSKN